MPFDLKKLGKKEYLYIGGAVASIAGLVYIMKRNANQVAGQTLAASNTGTSRAYTPAGNSAPYGSAAAGSGGAASAQSELGKAYLDYQFKSQQLEAQKAAADAQIASTDARAKLQADTQIRLAQMQQASQAQQSAFKMGSDAFSAFAPRANKNPDQTGDVKPQPPWKTGPLPSNPDSRFTNVAPLVGDGPYQNTRYASWIDKAQALIGWNSDPFAPGSSALGPSVDPGSANWAPVWNDYGLSMNQDPVLASWAGQGGNFAPVFSGDGGDSFQNPFLVSWGSQEQAPTQSSNDASAYDTGSEADLFGQGVA